MSTSHKLYSEKILDYLTSAVLVFNYSLELDYANPAAEDLFGISHQRLLGSKAVDLIQSTEDDVASLFDRAFKMQQPFSEKELSLIVMNRRMTVNCTVTPIQETQQILFEIFQVDHQLKITKEAQFIQNNKTTREIVRGLAHEINNPLGGIRGAAQLLEKALPSSSLQEYTKVIIEESDRLSSLLNQLLGPTHIPKREFLNIHQVLDRVRQIVMAEAVEDIVIYRDFDPSIPLVKGDIDQLIQVFLNIVRNAHQAARIKGNIWIKSRIKRQITIGGTRHRLIIKVDIIDDGPGIEHDLREKIFYPMVTGKANGTGLGLSIAQSLMNQYQGLIECQSQPGKTVFSVLLPLGN